MDDSRPPAIEKPVEDRVRDLGFDPLQLTPREREELVELYERFPEPLLTANLR